MRYSGCAALDLAYVASGRLDGYFHNKINLWDVAAGALMVEEAGGIVNDLNKFKVVHGRVNDKFSGDSYDHSWVEKGNLVFDDQTKITKPDGIPKDTYYDLYQPEVSEEYTAAETIMKCVESGHAGPWNDQLSEGSRIVPTSMSMSEWESYKEKNKNLKKKGALK